MDSTPLPIQKLPTEMILEILKHVDDEDLFALRRTNHNLFDHCEDAFKYLFRMFKVEWSHWSLARLEAIAAIPRLRNVPHSISSSVSDFDSYMNILRGAGVLDVQFASALNLLRTVDAVKIDIDLDLEGRPEASRLDDLPCFQEKVVMILKTVLGYFEEEKRPLHAMEIN